MKKILLISVLTTFSFLAGCHREGPAIAANTLKEVKMPFDSVVVLDKKVSDMTTRIPFGKYSKISVDRNIKQYTSAGMLKVLADIRNRTDYVLRLDICTKFFDEDGIEVDQSPASVFVLNPQETKTYSISSLNAKAKMYRVEIMGAK